MKLVTILSAIALPVLALAQEDAEATTTCTSTTTLTSTITIYGSNDTTVEPTASATGSDNAEPTAESAEDAEPTGAGAALDATRIALAGVAGMVVVALM